MDEKHFSSYNLFLSTLYFSKDSSALVLETEIAADRFSFACVGSSLLSQAEAWLSNSRPYIKH